MSKLHDLNTKLIFYTRKKREIVTEYKSSLTKIDNLLADAEKDLIDEINKIKRDRFINYVRTGKFR